MSILEELKGFEEEQQADYEHKVAALDKTFSTRKKELEEKRIVALKEADEKAAQMLKDAEEKAMHDAKKEEQKFDKQLSGLNTQFPSIKTAAVKKIVNQVFK